MIGLAIALLGGLVWIGLRGQADPATFLVGAVLATAVAWATRLPLGGRLSPVRLARKTAILAQLLARFAVDLAVANARQLRLVLAPRLRARPRWVRFTTRLERPATRNLLGVLISLTPGTVTQELRGDEYVIHVLDAGPDEDPVAVIRERFEAPLARLETP